MMTLDGAIKHAEEVAEEQEKLCKVNDSFNFSQPKWKKCANEHRQLAEWLRELKESRMVLDKIRAEIMDFEEELFHRPDTDYTDYAAVRHCVEIIDKYKAGDEE